jgi:predicted RNase H-like HicB family nuclease
MQYQVLVENLNPHSFVASVIGVADCRADGCTEEEAVAKATAALTERLTRSKIITIHVDLPDVEPHPLLKYAGRFKADPTFDDYLAEIEKYRQELDVERDSG